MKAKTFRKTFPMLPAIALTAATSALTSVLPARATTFIKDVMLIGGTSGETSALKNSLTADGWTFVNYDLNKGCGSGSDYVYLLYKAEADTSGDRDYITGFYIKSSASGVTTTLTFGGKAYTLTPYDGGSHFKGQKGDLNSNAGGDAIHLYYTKDASSGRAVSSVAFNTTESGALGANGASSPCYDLNNGCGGNTAYIYMHVTTSHVAYGLTYDLAGGTLYPAQANPSTYTANTATIALNNPARIGYTFVGWTWDGQSSPVKTVTIPQGSTGNRSFVANWFLDTYHLTYDLAGGTLPGGVSNPDTYRVLTPTFTLANPTRSGYTFMGWIWSGQTSPVKTVTIAQGSTGDRSFVAKFRLDSYYILYDLAGGTFPDGSTAATPYTFETPTFALTPPVCPGYTFLGWTWSGQSTPTTNVTIAQGSTGDKRFTANWSLDTYAISYDLVGGTLPSGTRNPTTYTVESAAFTLANPTRSGYVFTGWTWAGQPTPQTTVTIAQGSTGNRSYTANWNINSVGELDACEAGANYIYVAGWTYDPDVPSQSIDVQVQICQSDGTTLYTEQSLTADCPRDDVNGRYGITGQHGFHTTIPIATAGTYKVKVYAIDATTNSAPVQIGATKTVATTTKANIVRLESVPQCEDYRYCSYEAQDGDVLVGLAYRVCVNIADGATVTLCDATILNHFEDDLPNPMFGTMSAIHCLGNATIILATGTSNKMAGVRYHPAIQVGPPGSTLIIRGSGMLNAVNYWYDLGAEDLLPAAIYENTSVGIVFSAAGIGCVGYLDPNPPVTYYDGFSCGDIVIEGGTVNATGGYGCPGIGASKYCSCGTITIANGVTRITATGGENASSSIGPGIGGSCGVVTIGGVSVGSITQSPYTYDPKDQFVLAFDGNGAEGTTSSQLFTKDVALNLNDCTFSAPANWEFTGWNTAADGSGIAYSDGQCVTIASNMTLFAQWLVRVALNDDTRELTLNNNDMLTGTGGSNTRVTIADGAMVVLSGAYITPVGNWAGITCEGDATIIFEGDNAVMGGMDSPGIYVSRGKTLTIRGNGSLAVTGTPSIGGGGEGLDDPGVPPPISPDPSPDTGPGANIIFGPGLIEVTSGNTITITSVNGYARWALDNNFTGAWDAKDALGIHNVFRYAFGKPTGAFINPPLISISLENGQPVVHTPPLVNGDDFAFSVVVSDNVNGTGNVAIYGLQPSGVTVINETGKLRRFFRLRAVER